MFIEVTEILRCPQPHDESYLICGPVLMEGRDVVRGALTCPVCRVDYPILDGIAWFAPPDAGVEHLRSRVGNPDLTADAVHAFLDLQGGGGYLLLVGDAGRLAVSLSALVPNVALVAVNPPPDTPSAARLSVLRSPHRLPVKRHSVRAVVVGADAAGEPWLGAAIGTLLTGLRAVVEDQSAEPAGIVELARGAGVFVGEKRTR